MQKFKNHFVLDTPGLKVTDRVLRNYENKVPESLIKLWKTDGFGKYNDGLFSIINPEEYAPSLWQWLGREVENYVPFAMTGFGELFYYRKLADGEEDVCMIDMQYRNVQTLIWDFEAFFEDYLLTEDQRKLWLREDLFQKAIQELGPLPAKEVFTFVPILALGGAEDVSYLAKGNAQVYQNLVFQMTM